MGEIRCDFVFVSIFELKDKLFDHLYVLKSNHASIKCMMKATFHTSSPTLAWFMTEKTDLRMRFELFLTIFTEIYVSFSTSLADRREKKIHDLV